MPSWRPNCLRGSIYNDVPQHYSITPQITWQLGQEINEDRRGTVVVELQKKEGCGLGLTVSGGADKGQRPHVSNLRPGSIAHRCDALLVGDYIVSVNGIRTATLRHEEIINLLKNAGTNVTLEIEYEIPDSGFSGGSVRSHIHEVTLAKEVSGFGLTLRGGMVVDKMRAHPLTVVAVRHGGPADREGCIKVGDRVVAINGYKVAHLTLTETLSLFSQCDTSAVFTMSYDVAVQDAVDNASGPLLIEVDRLPGTDLGLSLSPATYQNKSCLCVDAIQPMRNADRSGALHAGDYILTIDGASVEAMSVAEASQLLKSGTEHSVQLEIIPFSHLEHCSHRDILARNSLTTSFTSHTHPAMSHSSSIYSNIPYNHHNKSNGFSSSNDHSGGSRLHSFSDSSTTSVGTTQFGTLNMRKRNIWTHGPERRATSCMSIASSNTSVLSANNQVCHTETVEVILFADHKGLGITLKGGVFSTAPLLYPPTIASVELRSPADKCGVLQEGDRVLTINGMETVDRTLEEVNHFLRDSRPRCVLLIEFDVAESVTPSSGTYIVKLAKKSGDTGITVSTAQSFKSGKDALYISDVRRGSLSYRTGSIQPGDKLLAVNDVRLDTCTPEDAMHLLELPDDIVKLKLQRDDPDEGSEGYVIYTVELQRFGGPLGITISGTEDPLDPIIISELTHQGLAERTGAIHVGDRLLAVSGNNTKNKPLSEAIRMLQSAGDIVTLKIARPDPTADASFLHVSPFTLGHSGKPSATIPSVDSAMESWDSSAHDIAAIGSPHHNYNSAMVLAVPHSTGAKQKNMHNPSDYVHAWDNDSENSSKDPENEDDSDEADNSSTQMDDWVKTLEEFDMGDGSEMLRQIGLSLRQRSVMSLDRKTAPENIAAAAAAMQTRSKSTCRVESLGSKSVDGMKNPALSDLLMDLNKSVSEATNTPKISQQDDKAKSCGALYTKMSPSSVNSPKTVKPLIKPKPKCNTAKKDHIQTVFTPQPVQLQKVVLEKTSPTDDFGFSISDGLYDRGVYINAIKSDSLAEKAGLRPLDRILQVKLLFIKDSPVMELSACFHRSNVQVLQSRLQWWRSSNVPGRSNTSSTNHDPAQLWLCSTSDTSRTNNSHHQRSVCASKSMKVTSVDGNCVSITSCRSKHNTSVLHGLLLRCLPIAKCSSQKTAMDSVPHSSSVGEGQEGEGLPGVLQKKSLGQNHNTHISEQEMSQWLEKETGLDRLRMMYSLSQDGSFIHEDTRDLNTMWLTTIGLGAGVSLALAYLEQHSEQQKLLKDMQPVLQGSFRKQVHWNKIVAVSAKNTLRITVVSALLIHLSQAIAAYRNKSSIWEYAVSATLASGSLGLGHGLRHLIKRSLWGAAAGIVGGYIACKCLTDNGVNQEQKHLDWVRLHWHERKVMKQTYE